MKSRFFLPGIAPDNTLEEILAQMGMVLPW
jgi:hypothetical protein